MNPPRPPAPQLDPRFHDALGAINAVVPASVEPQMIAQLRASTNPAADSLVLAASDRPLVATEHEIAVEDGRIVVSIVRRRQDVDRSVPGIVYLHGGGMVMGNRAFGAELIFDWVEQLGVAIASVDYRLAPEHGHPTPVNDCYAALTWVAEHAAELGISGDLVVAGASAGGGLAAALALMCRDRRGPNLRGQVLIYPMLDDRNDSWSGRQFDGLGVWDRTSNATGWSALLGDAAGSAGVSPHAAPARATDLSGLPPAFIDCTSTETFRDEDVDYARRLWADGSQAELHVWPGGVHGFDALLPDHPISVSARAARIGWLRRLLDL